jgi:hypothetical protein
VVALALLAAKYLHNRFIAVMLLFAAMFPAGSTLAETVAEAAYTRFVGDKYRDHLGAIRLQYTGDLFADSGFSTLISARQSFMQSFAPDSYGNEVESYERRTSLSFDQTIDTLSSLGASFGHSLTTGSSKTENRFYSIRGGHWWNKATLLTSLEMSQSGTDRKSRDYLDSDGLRVLTSNHVAGRTYSLGLTWLASTYAMVMASANTSTSSDRPIADSGSLEGRYFISDSLTALHLKVSAYRDRAMVERTTDYGQVQGREVEGQVHQHVTERWIAAVVHRRHWETETPRAAELPSIDRKSSSSQLRLRWRHVTGPVTEHVSEVYGYLGQYQSTQADSLIRHIGFGGKYVL